MITLQHSICELIKFNGDLDKFDKEIAYCLLPDGIRAYTGPRPLSHFEINPDGNDVSWYKFPTSIKNMTKVSAMSSEQHLANITKKSCFGETTDVQKYIEINKDLPETEYNGILSHLIQDYIFDEWVRKMIDCTNKYEPEASFVFDGQKLDSNEVRKLVAELENYGFYLLAYLCDKNYGITLNQEWFDEHVYSALKREYPEELAESTYKYMKIPEEINEKITNKDWSELTSSRFAKFNSEYGKLYQQVIKYTCDTDLFFEEFYKSDIKKDEKSIA